MSEVSLRTLRRRRHAAGFRRFSWNEGRDHILRAGWLTRAPKALAAEIGCDVTTLYKRAAEFDLPPRDPVQRALKAGLPPAPRITLPSLAFLSVGD